MKILTSIVMSLAIATSAVADSLTHPDFIVEVKHDTPTMVIEGNVIFPSFKMHITITSRGIDACIPRQSGEDFASFGIEGVSGTRIEYLRVEINAQEQHEGDTNACWVLKENHTRRFTIDVGVVSPPQELARYRMRLDGVSALINGERHRIYSKDDTGAYVELP